MSRVCSIDGCERRVLARGWCRTHYDRWYARTHKAEMKAARKLWVEQNPERMAQARANWNAENREWWTQRKRDRRRLHPEEKRAEEARRRARKRAVRVGRFTPAQLEQRLSMFAHNCWMCGAPGETIDHVKPLAKGGAHILSNLRPACSDCNNRKGAQWPFPFSSRGAEGAPTERLRSAA